MTGDLIARQDANLGFSVVLPVVEPQFVKIAVDHYDGSRDGKQDHQRQC